MKLPVYLAFACFLLLQCQTKPTEETETTGHRTLWVGTYTRNEGHVNGKAGGIYRIKVDAESGSFKDQIAKQGIINPSFVAVSPDNRFLYAVSETGSDVDSTGYLYAYKIGPDSLVSLNRQSSHSFAPCHVSVHPAGKWVFLANYVGGVVAMYPVLENGELGPASDVRRFSGSGPHPRQESSHPHSVFVHPTGRYVLTPDLGTDKIMIFKVDTDQGKLVPSEPAFAETEPGAGPRHLVFHPDGKAFYVINELGNTVTLYRFDPDSGAATREQSVSTLPKDFAGVSYTADIHLSPDGRFLYGSNRGHNSIAIFSVDPKDLTLTAVGHQPTLGDFPRNFVIDPSGQWLYVANQNTDNIVQFRIDPKTGLLSEEVQYRVPTPVCLVFD